MDLEWLNGLKRDWEIGETTVSRTINVPSMSKNVQVVFPDLTLPETCIRCKQQQLKKCPYMEKLDERYKRNT